MMEVPRRKSQPVSNRMLLSPCRHRLAVLFAVMVLSPGASAAAGCSAGSYDLTEGMAIGETRTLPVSSRFGNGNAANGLAILPNGTTALALAETGCLLSINLATLVERQVACIGPGDPTAPQDCALPFAEWAAACPTQYPPCEYKHKATNCWMDNSIAVTPDATTALVADTRTQRILAVTLATGMVAVLAGKMPDPPEDPKSRCSTGEYTEWEDGVGTEAIFNFPSDIVVAAGSPSLARVVTPLPTELCSPRRTQSLMRILCVLCAPSPRPPSLALSLLVSCRWICIRRRHVQLGYQKSQHHIRTSDHGVSQNEVRQRGKCA